MLMADDDLNHIVQSAHLKGAHGGLRLDAFANGWTRCYLFVDGVETFLGADTLDDCVARLIVVVAGRVFSGVPAPGEAMGYDIVSCFSLAERHFTICNVFTLDAKGGCSLLFIDGHDVANRVLVPLTALEVAQWRVTLAGFYRDVAEHLLSRSL